MHDMTPVRCDVQLLGLILDTTILVISFISDLFAFHSSGICWGTMGLGICWEYLD